MASLTESTPKEISVLSGNEEKTLPVLKSTVGFASQNTGPRDGYDPQVADETVRFPACFFDKRFWHLIQSIASFLFISFANSFFQARGTKAAEIEKKNAIAIKQLLILLGPTYIKLGQFLSVRRDLLPVVLADELASLQDRVPPFSLEALRNIVLKELGAYPEELFSYFDPMPLASASIGQVHRIQLKDGRQAVLKVQRPNLILDFNRDLGLMRLAAKTGLKIDKLKIQCKKFMPKFMASFLFGSEDNKPARFDYANWLEMSDEFGRNLFSEIDYLLEGRNADRFRRLFRDRPELKVPRVIWKFSGRRVLTLEYLEGIKISCISELKSRGIDLEQVGNLLITSYLEQIVIKGFFHADPHAGNLAVDRNGSLIVYDFGMVGEITEAQRRSLLTCVIATVNRDADTLVKSLSELGVVRQGTNHDAIARAITPFMDYYAGKSLFDLDFQQLEHDIDVVVTERSLRLPPNLAYILRAGSSLEGIARTLKPDFSFIQAVKPVVRKLIAIEGMESLSTLQGLMQLAGMAVNGLMKVSNQAQQIQASANSKPVLLNSQDIEKKKLPCRRCIRHVREAKELKLKIFEASLIGIAYVLLSSAGFFFERAYKLEFIANYQEWSLYLVIGNIILGGIMIWKLVHLSQWNLKQIIRDQNKSSQRLKK